jgi:hypothetical protein
LTDYTNMIRTIVTEHVESAALCCSFDIEALTHDIASIVNQLSDNLEGLDADLHEAVRVAYKRGATDWTRLNYPKYYEYLRKRADYCDSKNPDLLCVDCNCWKSPRE